MYIVLLVLLVRHSLHVYPHKNAGIPVILNKVTGLALSFILIYSYSISGFKQRQVGPFIQHKL